MVISAMAPPVIAAIVRKNDRKQIKYTLIALCISAPPALDDIHFYKYATTPPRVNA
jgi:hypothetical protein